MVRSSMVLKNRQLTVGAGGCNPYLRRKGQKILRYLILMLDHHIKVRSGIFSVKAWTICHNTNSVFALVSPQLVVGSKN
jgi:hypothetical protein